MDEDQKPKRRAGRTGPRTEEGKRRSSENATKHGACATRELLRSEAAVERAALVQTWMTAFAPQDAFERKLVMEAVDNDWLKIRATKQFGLVAERLEEIDAMEWGAEEHGRYERFLRYKTAAERAFSRSVRTLEQHRKARQQEVYQSETRQEGAVVKAQKAAADRGKGPVDIYTRMGVTKPPGAAPLLSQLATITSGAGGTKTSLYPGNEQLRRAAKLTGEETKVIRRLEFVNGAPTEYEWARSLAPTALLGGEASVPLARLEQTMNLFEWLKAVEKEEADGAGHLGPAGQQAG